MVKVIQLALLSAVLVLLWLFPIMLFPHPATNDAIELSALELPVLLLGLLGLLLVLVIRRERATVVRTGLGIFLLGVAADFVIGLFTFGNFSDDRFMPLLFLPFPIGLAGLVTLAVGVALSGLRRNELLRGAIYGVVAAVVVGVWLMLRGARDWLLAPYGFDITVVILVIGAAVFVLGDQVRDAGTSG